jgi:hypothetical protein
MSASEDVYQAAQDVVTATKGSLTVALNTFVTNFVGWPFVVAPGYIVNGVGERTEATQPLQRRTGLMRALFLLTA